MRNGFFNQTRTSIAAPLVRSLHISAASEIKLSESSKPAGCILKISCDFDEVEGKQQHFNAYDNAKHYKMLAQYFSRSYSELLRYIESTLDERYLAPHCKFFIGFVQQSVFSYKENDGLIDNYNTFGGHALAGVTNSKLKFFPETIVSKISSRHEASVAVDNRRKNAHIFNPYTGKTAKLLGQDYATLAKYETLISKLDRAPNKYSLRAIPGYNIFRWIYAYHNHLGAEKWGSGMFLAIVPLELTNINYETIAERILLEKEKFPNYHRLLSACGQSLVRVYANATSPHFALSTQEAMVIILRSIAANEKIEIALFDATKKSKLATSPFRITPYEQADRNYDQDADGVHVFTPAKVR